MYKEKGISGARGNHVIDRGPRLQGCLTGQNYTTIRDKRTKYIVVVKYFHYVKIVEEKKKIIIH